MDSVGDAYDNAVVESFFTTLETELLERVTFEIQLELFEYIESWYNPDPRHSAWDYEFP